jgi:hypothetical protein
VIALIDLLQAGISHLQRHPASITRATIFEAETPRRFGVFSNVCFWNNEDEQHGSG